MLLGDGTQAAPTYIYVKMPHSEGSGAFCQGREKLHLLGSLEAQDVQAALQQALGQADQGDVAGLLALVLLGEDARLVVELVDGPASS